jgi:RNA polymerase sigma-70 factor, ECF subfamily
VFADAALTLSRMDASPASLVGLLYTIARRRFADEARRNGHRGERVPLEAIDDELPAPEYGSNLAHAIREAIAQLPDEQRRVVCLKLIEGCPFAEIASLTGATEAAAKMRFQRGLAAVRRRRGDPAPAARPRSRVRAASALRQRRPARRHGKTSTAPAQDLAERSRCTQPRRRYFR